MSFAPWLRQRIGSLTFGMAILVLVTLLCGVVSVFFAIRFVTDTVALVSNNLASRSGLNLRFVTVVVIVGTIPFFWAIVMFTKNVWGFLKLAWNSLALYKNKYGLIVVAYVALYFLVMYGASLQANPYKYCADTPEGIFSSSSPGKDPVYGIELSPCTRNQTLMLRHLKPPQELSIKDAKNYEWFDRVSGQPRVWYSMPDEQTYRFFDRQGVDPFNRQALKPVTTEVVDRVEHKQAEIAAVREAAEKKAADGKFKEAAAARQAQVQAEMATQAHLAERSFEAKDYQSAIDTCTRVLESLPRDPTCTSVKQHASMKLSEQFVNQGLAHWEKGEFDEAKWNAEKALDLDPANQSAAKLKRLADQLKARATQ